jgi:hypothetical protein
MKAARVLILVGALTGCGGAGVHAGSESASAHGRQDESPLPEATGAETESGRAGEACEGPLESRSNCAEGLRCCVSFSGRCGGTAPMPGEVREPCVTRAVCAAVERCWGPPP